MGGFSPMNVRLGDVVIYNTRKETFTKVVQQPDIDGLRFSAHNNQSAKICYNRIVAMVKGNDRLPRIIEYQKGSESVALV